MPEQPIASELIEDLKYLATEVKKNQIEDAVGTSWAALAVEQDLQGREIRDFTGRAGSRKRRWAGERGQEGGGRGGEGRGGGPGGRGC